MTIVVEEHDDGLEWCLSRKILDGNGGLCSTWSKMRDNSKNREMEIIDEMQKVHGAALDKLPQEL